LTATLPHRYLARFIVIERWIVALLVPSHIGFATMPYLMAVAATSSIWLLGCQATLHSSGLDLDKLQSDIEVQRRLGTPISSGATEGKQFKDFRTHQKIAQKWDGIGYAMGFEMTFGLSDLIFFPIEVVKASSETINGHDVRVIYEPDGKVGAILVDGKYHVGGGELVSREQAKLRQQLRQAEESAPSLPSGPLIELPVPPIDPKGVYPQHP
jgi:hypothetical protein